MNWNEYMFNLVDAISLKSKDNSNKVGCVIVGDNYEILSTGFNGFPIDVEEKENRFERPLKYFYTEHAERNAIYLAARRGTPLTNSRIYLKWFPCAECARAIIQSGIKEIFIDGKSYNPDVISERDKRWEESFTQAKLMLLEANISIKIIKGEN